MANDILALEGEWEKHPKHKTSIEAALRFIKDEITSKHFSICAD